MRAHADHGRLALQRADHGEEPLLLALIIPQIRKVRHQPSGTFHREKPLQPESGFFDLGSQFVREVEESGGEVGGVSCRIAVLAVFEILLNNAEKHLIAKITAKQAVE